MLTPTSNDTSDPAINDPDLWKIARWVSEIALYDREADPWYKKSKKIIKRYKDERTPIQDKGARFNVLWSNTQTLLPALYAKNPKPDIQRRFKDADPIGRVASDVLERSDSYFCDTDTFAACLRNSVLDYLLGGRGSVWVRYVPHLKQEPLEVTDDAVEGEEESLKQETSESVEYEEVIVDYVHPEDFGHNICRTYEELYCGWRKVYLTRKELIKRFGDEKGKLPPLDYRYHDKDDRSLDNGIAKATIYELWDSRYDIAVWFHKDVPEALDLRDDPLKLDGFFPFPKPLFSNLANDSLIPVPDYAEYQDQALELDSLTARISSITKSLKVAGVYDASAQGVARLLSEGTENQLIPVEQWAIFGEKGGLKGVMDFLPIQEIAEALFKLYEARQQVKQDMWEITGLADIVRGVSDPNETLGAQQLKSNFATNRISDKQREVQRFARSIIRIMTDIICNHFQPDTIKLISGVQLFTNEQKGQVQSGVIPPQSMDQDQLERMMNDPTWEDVFGLIKNNALRCFRIDIETDSTIKADEEQDKQSRMEYLNTMGQFLEKGVGAMEQMPAIAPFVGEAIMFGSRAFPVGKQLEGTLNSAIQKIQKEAANPQQKPDPEQMKIQAEQQIEQMKLQAEQQLEQQKMQSQAQIDQQRNILEAQRDKARLEAEMQMEAQKAQLEQQTAIRMAHIESLRAIEVARISAKATAGVFEEARELSMQQTGAADMNPDIVTKQVHALSQAMQALASTQQQTAQLLAKNTQDIHATQAQATQSHAQTMQAVGQLANMTAQNHLRQQQNHADLIGALTAEKELVRDPETGRATGVRVKKAKPRAQA